MVIPVRGTLTATRMAFATRCALLLAPDGSVWGWGQNREILGPAGSKDDLRRFRRVPIGVGWLRIAAMDHGGVGLQGDGSLQRWHFDSGGHLTITPLAEPKSPGTNSVARTAVWIDVVAGGQHLLGLKSDGTLFGLGANQRGQLGDGTFYGRAVWTPVRSGQRWSRIGAGDAVSFGIDSGGLLWHWGFIENPGIPNSGFDSRVPNRVAGGPWIQVEPGHAFSGVLGADHRWWGWGPAAENVLGSTNRHLPFALPIGPESRAAIACSTAFAVLDSEGHLWSLGRNPGAAVGDDLPPVAWRRVFESKRWTQLWAGGDTAFGVDDHGVLWTWGLDLSIPSPVDRALSATSEWLRDHGIPAKFGQADNRWNSEPLALARFVSTP